MAEKNLSLLLTSQDRASANLNKVKGSIERVEGAGPKLAASLKAASTVGVGAFAALATAAFKLGEEFDASYDKIVVGTGATGAQLEGLKDSFRNVVASVPASFEKASTAIADLNTRTGLTGPALEGLARQTLELTRLFGGDLSENIRLSTRLFGDWDIAAEHMPLTLDKIATASQASGIPIGNLMQTVVQFGAPLRAMNFSFDESIALLSKWDKEGVNTELVLGSLRIAMGEFARSNVPMREGLEQTIARIQELGPGAEATGLAMDVFGARAGPDMAAAILEGRFAIDDMVKALDGAEGKVTDTADATRDAQERMTMAFNRVKLAMEPVASFVFNTLATAMETGLALFDQFSTIVQFVANDPLPALFRILRTLSPAVDALASGFEAWQGIFQRAGEWIDGLVRKLQGLARSIKDVPVIGGLAMAITGQGRLQGMVENLPEASPFSGIPAATRVPGEVDQWAAADRAADRRVRRRQANIEAAARQEQQMENAYGSGLLTRARNAALLARFQGGSGSAAVLDLLAQMPRQEHPGSGKFALSAAQLGQEFGFGAALLEMNQLLHQLRDEGVTTNIDGRTASRLLSFGQMQRARFAAAVGGY